MKLRQWAGLLTLVATQAASDPLLGLPLDCILGETCFIQNFVDHDADETARDFTCGPLSYDGHKGTDFALPSHAAMQAGVNVRAAAPGVVRGVRDGMADRAITSATLADVKGRECGNGVVIEHADGWVTQYCHMKRGSLSVKTGQQVSSSTVLGQVGLSGKTEFPHLHLSVRQDDTVVDPFTPEDLTSCGAASAATLWQVTPDYRPGGLIRAGFATAIPGFDAVKTGAADVISIARDAPAIVLFGYAFGGRSGDSISMWISGPLGKLSSSTVKLDKNQAQFFRASGKKQPSGGWPTGRYVGHVRFERDGVLLGEMRQELQVE